MKTNHADLDRFLRHQADIAAGYNAATDQQKKELENMLANLKARRVASVGGLRSLFPALTGKLQVTKEVLQNER